MTLIHRVITEKIRTNSLQKIQVIYGPRQVGKTTLAQEIIKERNKKTLFVHGEKLEDLRYFQREDRSKLSAYIAGYDVIFVDEAQKITNIGSILKLIYDTYPEKQILVTGSSSLELAQGINEPLTGRKTVYHLYPISFQELQNTLSLAELDAYHHKALIFGTYPGVVNQQGLDGKKEILQEITNAYLFKDLTSLGGITNHHALVHICKLLAFQIGQEVSLNEISQQVGVSIDTVKKYIRHLEQAFIIFSVSGRNKNLRKEVSKMNKYYFTDLGIRNTLINNYNDITMRTDLGALRENFLLVEKRKKNEYTRQFVNSYFRRTHTGAEIDYIEEYNGILHAVECKYKSKNSKVPKTFADTYPQHTFTEINMNNYLPRII